LRELARFDAAVALLERNPDICEGTSKSNSAIVHTGFDTPPGLLEARLLAEARELWPNVIDNLHIPYLQTGALMEVARLAGDASFQLTPRKGQFIIVEEDHGVSQIILPVPSRISKGILVTPIVFGGVLLGPTAEEVTLKTDLSTTAQGLQQIREGIRKLVPVMAEAASVRQFAGLRAVSSTGDYIIRPSTVSSRMLHVAGIRSTGLSASPAIGRYAASLVRDELDLSSRSGFVEELPEYLTNTRADEGDIICLCRSITRGEVLAAMRSPLPPTTLDGLKRRSGVMLGDCQGNLCMPRLIDLFQQQLGRDPLTLDKNVAHSSPIAGHVSNLASEPVNLESSLLEGRDGLNG
jgi:glycerol-3-phosphate dehydrogenase